MLKEQCSIIRKANIVADAALVVTAFAISFEFRLQLGGLTSFDSYTWLLFVVIPLWLILLDRYGFYGSKRLSNLWEILCSLACVTTIGGVIASSLIFAFEPKGFSREFFGTFLLSSFLLLAIEQILVRRLLQLLRLEGYNIRNILLVGTGESAKKIITILERQKGWGLKVVGIINPREESHSRTFCGLPVLGSLDILIDVCKSRPVDEVIFCDSKYESKFELDRHLVAVNELGITARTVLNLYYRYEGKKELGMLHGEVPLLTFRSVPADADQLFLKRCLDIAGATVGLMISACLFPFIALAIKLESPGPLFFGQTRVRENGRTFTCWKFRSMYQDAEARKQELMHLNEMQGALFKMKNDPRVTRVGAFLRKTSLDELPQFWNVLIGEMSLVGTRPPTPAEVAKYLNWQRKRICMKPGMTGLWQVSGRNSISDFDDVVRLDLQYIDSWSVATDLRLILRTLKVVFLREGAC